MSDYTYDRTAIASRTTKWPAPLVSTFGRAKVSTHVTRKDPQKPAITVLVTADIFGWEFLFTVLRYTDRASMRMFTPELHRAWRSVRGVKEDLPTSPYRLAKILPKGLYAHCQKQALDYTPVKPHSTGEGT